MAYSAEIVRRARQRLESMRADRDSQNRERLLTAYTQIPRIKEIDLQLRQSMALAAQAVFTQGGDARAAMEQVKQANLALQEERKQLIAQHFGEGWLDEAPVCSHCGGSGYLGSQMCSCLLSLCREEQEKELSLLSGGQEQFRHFRLDYYPDRVDPKYGRSMRAVMEKTYNMCLQYAQNFSLLSGNLLFSGDTGLGKTFLSACIAKVVAGKGYSVVYESAPHLRSFPQPLPAYHRKGSVSVGRAGHRYHGRGHRLYPASECPSEPSWPADERAADPGAEFDRRRGALRPAMAGLGL